ncbi:MULTISPECIES: hypothetical protein [unclassified Microbacterium]|uniref:hypothetical protein n=1 Tax=unclassified Microbacterium TaxID=2609290 RepID=UPI000CFD9367|nr:MULTISPECIES: hypothetical protein [unclassified Microbacterium]PQZ60533.1 hypothetical protein CQ032_03195 [Microbacterium sp. MYb43]PQZ81959.1 hypothetical protein CQ031_00595 [Microbacterium sp. MYb40]PRB22222.1 hypothetical protein CQ040_06170 [Microbacterium sp. MYb54]PRB31213.1 hypothetical protein CQ037_03860 [Microbacterium sp. MYb50]PRB69822.1 hypothetical protein CQ021_03640 [Microbacterium sp. MYb24]
MTITPRRNPSALLSLLLAGALLLGGCAVVSTETGGAETPSTPAPTPTAACPQIDGVVLPPECAPYDPDHAMAQNDRHRDRMDLSDEAAAAAVQPVSDLRVRLEALRAEGEISVQAVEGAFQELGLPDAVVRGDEGAVEFGAAAPEGGCVFGEVRHDAVLVEAGGYIMDGGCLPAQ